MSLPNWKTTSHDFYERDKHILLPLSTQLFVWDQSLFSLDTGV